MIRIYTMKNFVIFFLAIIPFFSSCTKEPSDEESKQQYREIAWKSLKPEEKAIVITPIKDAEIYETTYKDIWSFAVVFVTLTNGNQGSITVYIHAADKVYLGKLKSN